MGIGLPQTLNPSPALAGESGLPCEARMADGGSLPASAGATRTPIVARLRHRDVSPANGGKVRPYAAG